MAKVAYTFKDTGDYAFGSGASITIEAALDAIVTAERFIACVEAALSQ